MDFTQTTWCFQGCVAKWGVDGASSEGSITTIAFMCQSLPLSSCEHGSWSSKIIHSFQSCSALYLVWRILPCKCCILQSASIIILGSSVASIHAYYSNIVQQVLKGWLCKSLLYAYCTSNSCDISATLSQAFMRQLSGPMQVRLPLKK
jgi:hypothetical protein